MNDYYYLYIYNMTPIGIKQRLTKNLFNNYNNANRQHKKKPPVNLTSTGGMCIQKKLSRSECVVFMYNKIN